jgi:hypothetical protein
MDSFICSPTKRRVRCCGWSRTEDGSQKSGDRRQNAAGNWSGTTVQGEAITFTVSADEKVTSIDLGYGFNGCSGSKSFSSLSLETARNVTCIPGPCPAAVSSYRAFHFFEGGTTFDAPSTTVNGFFPAPGRASGTLNLVNYEGCGTARGVGWNATRR